MVEEIAAILRQTMRCNVCFESGKGLCRSEVDTPQPRPIGYRYGTSDLRVVLMTLNPNQGSSATHASDNRNFRRLLHTFRDGGPFEPVAEHTHRGLRSNWFGGHFKTLYLDAFGLDLDEIAVANIAWCATVGDYYPEEDLLRPCFKRNTKRLLQALQPDVVLLAGKTDGKKFFKEVQAACPRAEVGVVLHCSYLGRLHDERKKQQCISEAKAEFDGIMARGKAKRATHRGAV